MIRLSSTSEKLQAVLVGSVTTNQLHCVVSYSDHTSTAYSGGTQYTSTNNVTAVDICDAPAASTVRDIDYINIRNRDTAVATVTVMVDVSAADSELVKATLAVGDQLTYTHGTGWQVIDASGNAKTSSGLGAMTSAQLAAAISDETGSGALVFATAPTFVSAMVGDQGTEGSGINVERNHLRIHVKSVGYRRLECRPDDHSPAQHHTGAFDPWG